MERRNGGPDYDQGVRSLCLPSGPEAHSRSVHGQLVRGSGTISRTRWVWGEALDVRNWIERPMNQNIIYYGIYIYI